MSTLTLLRWTGAVWFVPVVFAIGVYVGVRELAFRTGYPVADLAIASYELTLVGPIVATYCAFRLSGFARSLDVLAAARPGLVAVVGAWWPLIVGPPVAAVLALLVATRGSFPNDAASWQIVGLVFATVLACGCLGMALAHALPIAAAVPLAAAVTFWWLAFQGAGTNVVLRNVNSGFVVCCTSSQVPSPLMIQGSALVVGILTLGVLLTWLVPRWERRRRGSAAVVVVSIVVVAVSAGTVHVRSADQSPTLKAVADRTTAQECALRARVQICTWPENESRTSVVRRHVVSMNHHLVALGLPAVVRAHEDTVGARTVGFSAHDSMSAGDIRYSLADGYARWQNVCRADGPANDPPPAVIAFVGLASGLSETSMRHRFDEREVTKAASVLVSGDDAARLWFDQQLGPNNAVCGE